MGFRLRLGAACMAHRMHAIDACYRDCSRYGMHGTGWQQPQGQFVKKYLTVLHLKRPSDIGKVLNEWISRLKRSSKPVEVFRSSTAAHVGKDRMRCDGMLEWGCGNEDISCASEEAEKAGT
eukprot:scaffold310485_cov22-Tisochrysis_lutea.AAC.1